MSGVEEHPETPTTIPDAMSDEGAADEALRISSLHASPRQFSMRRLLNVASVAVAAVLLVALAMHWLPGVFSGRIPRSGDPQMHASQTLGASVAPTRGTGWKPIGPDWATDITFTDNGALGYACGAFPSEPVVFFAAYDVHQQTWKQFPTPATAADQCQVSVSPTNPFDVALIADSCMACTDPPPTSQAYRTYDGGATWTPLRLPPSLLISDIAWSDGATLFLAAENTSTAGTSNPPTYSLLVSRAGGPLASLDLRRLAGLSETFGNISLLSGGGTLYASLTALSCPTECTTYVSSSDGGLHWTAMSASTADGVIVPQAAQPRSNTLFGSTFSASSQTLALFRSDDNGASWSDLPAFPRNPLTGGALIFALPDNSVYAYCFGPVSAVYALQAQAQTWQAVAALPDGLPLTVQYDAEGRALALWGEAHEWSQGNLAPGLEYFPLSQEAR